MMKLAFLFLSLFAFCTASAQVTTSSMSGRVADTDGQPIIGATIVAVHTPTGTQYATASTRNGQFNLGGMRVGGPYDVEVSFIGCNTEKIEGIYLTIGEEATLDFVLREDSQSIGEVVVVGKANPVFNANRTGAQEVVTLEMMEKLPTTSRSLDEFVKLTPMSSGKNFAGTSYRFNNVTVDGASFNNSFGLSSALGAQGTEPISLESIEQVQVMIAPYDVRNGGFTGGGINSVTKSGTNEWHASAYMYTKSPELQGRRVRDYVGQVSEFSNRQYGVSLSGPIVKNKLFFFVNGELDRQDEPISNRLADSRVSAAELADAVDMTQSSSPEEHVMLSGIVNFVNTEVQEIMKPRVDITALSMTADYETVKRTIIESGFSRIPVYEEDIDNIRGTLYVKDLLPYINNGDEFGWQQLLRKAYFVPEHKKINDLLEEFQSNKVHMAVVVDEYGSTLGIVSLEDILEEIVGEISDESDAVESAYTKLADRNYLFDGMSQIGVFERILQLPENTLADVKGEAETLAGLMLEIKRDFLKKGDVVTTHDLRFTAHTIEGRRIDKVQVTLPE